MHDYTQADLDDQTSGMLDFAVKLTKNPSGNRNADVEHLRSLGLSDQQILSTVLITCNFNFMTRLADGLGVEVPEARFEDAKRWMSDDVQGMSWLMQRKEV
jgi:alkylhydroperoxidase family enzyme